MTQDEQIEIDYLTIEAKRLGLHLRSHINADPCAPVLFYVQELKQFPGRDFQTRPPSLGKYMAIEAAQAFVRDYRAAFPRGRTDEQTKV